jgi:hypothetical protein
MKEDMRYKGVVPSPPDDRDYQMANVIMGDHPACLSKKAAAKLNKPLPSHYRTPGFSKLINHFDQGESGMCAACAGAYTRHARECHQTLFANKFSPSYIYAHRSGIQDNEEGMYLRDMFSILKKYGCCSWKNFPHFGTYAQVFKRYRKYADQLDQIAKKYRIDSYYAINVDSKEEIKRAVYSLGAVVISVPCYEGCGPDWTAEEVKKNGKWIPMKWPEISSYEEDPERRGTLIGYHAMTITGWTSKGWIVENSWGDWGESGAAVLPYDYPFSEAWTAIDDTTSKASMVKLNKRIVK